MRINLDLILNLNYIDRLTKFDYIFSLKIIAPAFFEAQQQKYANKIIN
jgi:hypothetical protein